MATIPTRPYNEDVDLSIIGFGGMVVVGMDKSDAADIVGESVERGVNYFDVAPSYADGEAEEKLGIALEPYRKDVFLACKTGERKAEGAKFELERSLKRLRTDYFDLYQLHAMTTVEDVETALGPGGAWEVYQQAQRDGQVKYLGFSAHSEEAALALLEQIPLDSVLFPMNFTCFANGDFGPRVIARAKEQGVARLALKAMAYTTRPQKDAENPFPNCWYRPVEDPTAAGQALRFTLSLDITAAVPPGDPTLYRRAMDVASDFTMLPEVELVELLALTEGMEPIFHV